MNDLYRDDKGPDSESSAPSTKPLQREPALFAAREPERDGGRSVLLVWALAAAIVLVGLTVLLVGGHKGDKASASGPRALDPYAGSLAIGGLAMSESSSLSAVKVTYIDGTIRNTGGRTVTGATVQVLFANDEQLPPQVETLPMTLIRTHEPYVDTEPVSADPIKPGQEREFRLIFENIGSNWNQQIPEIRIVRVE